MNMIRPLREVLRAWPGGMAAQSPQSYRIGKSSGCGPHGMTGEVSASIEHLRFSVS
jgi:hypothetical protein